MRTAIGIAGLLAGMVLGCASTGHKFDMSAADKFQPGVTTEADAIGALGPPTSQMVNADGTKLITWSYGKSTMLGSGAKVLTIQFDHSGKMMGVFQQLTTSGPP